MMFGDVAVAGGSANKKPMPGNRRSVVGVILAGGEGVRMQPVSCLLPKPLLPICNQPLIRHHLKIMRAVGIREVFVVIGRLGDSIRDKVGNGGDLGLQVVYVEQRDRQGIAHALGLLETYVRSPFLLFLADIFFRPRGLESVMADFRGRSRGSYLVVRDDTFAAIQRNFAVVYDPATGRVRRVIEKPKADPGPSRLKGCGLYLLDLPVFDAIRRTRRSALRHEYELTDALQVLIDDGEPVEIAKVVEEDVNLSTPLDLLECNLKELDRQGQENLLGRRTVIAPTASVRRCVLGDDVRVEGSVCLENCLVFPQVTVRARPWPIRNCIITGAMHIDC